MTRKESSSSERTLTAEGPTPPYPPEIQSQDPQAVPKPAREIIDHPLFAKQSIDEYKSRWDSIQAAFVDEPRQSVDAADKLVADAIKQSTEVLAAERHKLETHHDGGNDVATEELRLALQRYRAFFKRLLGI